MALRHLTSFPCPSLRFGPYRKNNVHTISVACHISIYSHTRLGLGLGLCSRSRVSHATSASTISSIFSFSLSAPLNFNRKKRKKEKKPVRKSFVPSEKFPHFCPKAIQTNPDSESQFFLPPSVSSSVSSSLSFSLPSSASSSDSHSKSSVPFHSLRKTWSQLHPFIRPYFRKILLAWLCTVAAVASLTLFVPRIGALSALLATGDLTNLLRQGGFLLALVIVRSLSQYGQDALLWEVALAVTLSLRSYVYEKIQGMDMSEFEGRGGVAPGDVAFRVTSEAEDTGDTVFAMLHALIPSLLQLVAMLARMISLSPLLTMATFCVIPGMGIVIAILGERVRRISRTGQDSIAAISTYMNEVLPAMLLVKAHAAEEFESHRFRHLAEIDCAARLRKKKLKALFPQAITGAYALAVMSLLAVGAWAISQGRFTGPKMVSFIMSLVLLVEPLQAVASAYNEIKQGEPAVERLLALTSLKPKVVEAEDAEPLGQVVGQVELQNVSFAYEERGPLVLKDVSLKVRPGETVALVGPSGSGKSTVLKLLLRLYDPLEGRVLIDDLDISRVTLKSLRQKVGIVPQETVLFSGTVAQNIAYGILPDAVSMEAVEQAAQMANAHKFISELSHGYMTNLGDRASSLSGGQRQRLAIARAVYHQPSIMTLDEATSALDNQSEELVREALNRLMVGRTVVVVAHRLETVRNADRIVFMEGGRIIEEGTHDSLLLQGGSYASLYKGNLRASV